MVWDDSAAGLADGRVHEIKRASHVEPFGSGWVADMSPSGGPWLFADGEASDEATRTALTPFRLRADALTAERNWLATHCGL